MSEELPTAPLELKSFEPDLEVIVGSGEEQQVFRYHAVILASYSTYIDTMLSTPMKEQVEMKISFPEISGEMWAKLIKGLGPGGSREWTVIDVNEVLPVYDKYGFQGGVDMCDSIICECLQVRFSNTATDILVRAAVLSHQLDLPRSKANAIKYAKEQLRFITPAPAYTTSLIKELVHLVHDEEDVLRYVVCTIMGRKNDMTVEEMVAAVEEDSFADNYHARSMQIWEQEQMLEKLTVRKIQVSGASLADANGEYQVRSNPKDLAGGAMKDVFTKCTDLGRKVVLEAMDPFGKTWRISTAGQLDEEEGHHVLYWWESDCGSLVPPKLGWTVGPEGELPTPRLTFDMGGRYY